MVKKPKCYTGNQPVRFNMTTSVSTPDKLEQKKLLIVASITARIASTNGIGSLEEKTSWDLSSLARAFYTKYKISYVLTQIAGS